MENNKENYAWASALVSQMSVLPGFNQIKPEGLEAYVDFCLRIFPGKKEGAWAINTALEEEEKFPPPVFLREILERRWRSADKPPLPGMPGYVPPPMPE